MLGIELPKDAEKEISLGQIKDVVHGMDEMRKEADMLAQQPVADSKVAEKPQKPEQSDDNDRKLLERYQAVFEKYHMSLEAAGEGDGDI